MIFRKNRPEESAPAETAAEPAAPPQGGEQQVAEAVPAGIAVAGGQSVLTSDVVMEGNLVTSGDLHLDGTVHGAVQAQRVLVDANGAVSGQLVAQEVEIRGRVIGPICAVRVKLVAGAQVEGDVMSQSLSVDEGAFIDGQIRHSEDPLGEWQQMWYGEEEAGHGEAEAAEGAAGAGAEAPDLAPYLRPEGIAGGEKTAEEEATGKTDAGDGGEGAGKSV